MRVGATELSRVRAIVLTIVGAIELLGGASAHS